MAATWGAVASAGALGNRPRTASAWSPVMDEKRLNVIFSRARMHMAVVSSIRHGDITNDYNDGANCLRNFLEYAAACSAGESAKAR